MLSFILPTTDPVILLSLSRCAHKHFENFPLHLLILSMYLLNYVNLSIYPSIHSFSIDLSKYADICYPFTNLSIHLFIPTHPASYLSTHQHIHSSIMHLAIFCLSINPLIHPSTHSSSILLFTYSHIHPSVHLFTEPSTHLPTHPYFLYIYPFLTHISATCSPIPLSTCPALYCLFTHLSLYPFIHHPLIHLSLLLFACLSIH